MVGPSLLIDARNVVYRSVYAGRSNKGQKSNYHFFTIFLRQLCKYINDIRPSSVHIFWDAPRESVWRRSILATYKNRTSSNYVENLSEDLELTTNVAKIFFSKMGVRQYERPQMEADDLIYAAVSVLHSSPTVIVSSDSDMMQIPFRFNSSSVFDPKTLQIIPVPNVNPVYTKALEGDTADSIDGYYGVGPVTSKTLLENKEKLYEYFKIKGSEIFNKNILLIDLSMCPKLLANTIYIHKKLSESIEFDQNEIQRLIGIHKVNGLYQEFMDLILPFKNFI